MKSRTILFFLCYLVWCLLNWVPDWQHLLVGAFVSGLVVFIFGDLFFTNSRSLGNPVRFLYFIFVFVPVFLWECLKANVDVAFRVIHPALPINPGIVKVKTALKSETGLAFLANSVTLTPGTLTVDIDAERGFLYVHWINVKATDVEKATQLIVGRFENILMKVFE